MQRLRAAAISCLASVLAVAPFAVAHRLAHLCGAGLYVVQPARRELVRSNLRRVCADLHATGRANARTSAAARDPRALEHLVRLAFGHYVRSYLEMMLASRLSGEEVARRIALDDPAVVAEALEPDPGRSGAAGPDSGRIFIGLHLGSIELPALYGASRSTIRFTAPMEVVDDPALQTYLENSRSATGIRIIPTEGARSALMSAVRTGGALALVADRPLRSAAHTVDLFGAPASLPVGPCLLALLSGAPTYVVAARRIGWGRYAARMERVPVPTGGSMARRRDVFLAAQVRLFEDLIADAPEQWWTMFFPIWETRAAATRSDERTAA